jgi:predicted regulator of Ras-like GTPase activity (Roadblock/LC7/MglB family)
MSSEALANLSKTDGVLGVVVFDDQGTCLVHHLPPPYEPILIAEVVRRLSSAFEVFAAMGDGTPTSFSVDCEDGSMVLRYVDRHWVVALTHPDVNMNLLNVAMNVVVLNLGRGYPGSGTQPTTQRLNESMTGRSSGSLSMSHSEGDVEIPPDAVDRSVVQQLLAIYREFLGPAAKLVFKQQLGSLGVSSRTLRRAQVGDLVARLAAKIPVPQRQKEFVAAARKFQDRVLL